MDTTTNNVLVFFYQWAPPQIMQTHLHCHLHHNYKDDFTDAQVCNLAAVAFRGGTIDPRCAAQQPRSRQRSGGRDAAARRPPRSRSTFA
jgi:hypothetical protein